jgi:hypothetical protein
VKLLAGAILAQGTDSEMAGLKTGAYVLELVHTRDPAFSGPVLGAPCGQCGAMTKVRSKRIYPGLWTSAVLKL